MDDLLHDTLDVAITLREVEGAELRRGLVEVGMGFELLTIRPTQRNVARTLCIVTYDSVGPPLCPNYPTHA